MKKTKCFMLSLCFLLFISVFNFCFAGGELLPPAQKPKIEQGGYKAQAPRILQLGNLKYNKDYIYSGKFILKLLVCCVFLEFYLNEKGFSSDISLEKLSDGEFLFDFLKKFRDESEMYRSALEAERSKSKNGGQEVLKNCAIFKDKVYVKNYEAELDRLKGMKDSDFKNSISVAIGMLKTVITSMLPHLDFGDKSKEEIGTEACRLVDSLSNVTVSDVEMMFNSISIDDCLVFLNFFSFCCDLFSQNRV